MTFLGKMCLMILLKVTKEQGFTLSFLEKTQEGEEKIDLPPIFGSKHLHKNELKKAYFAHDTAYSDSKNLAKRTAI